MQKHNLKRKNPNLSKKLVGRGGKRGKTSGRGHKGQKARAGHKLRPEIRDFIKKVPKRRGYGKNRSKSYNAGNVKPQGINLAVLEKNFNAGDMVDLNSLSKKNLIKRKGNKKPVVKILGKGELKKKLAVEGLLVSNTAKEEILKAGGSVK